MDFPQILKQFLNDKIVLLPSEMLPGILAQSEIIDERDTLISDNIRILRYKNRYFVQELTPKNEIALREFPTLNHAKIFVEDRMEIYDKMWDGCGCKVNYYK